VDLVALENRLSDSLSSPVDLAPARSLRECIRERVAEEAVFAFLAIRHVAMFAGRGTGCATAMITLSWT